MKKIILALLVLVLFTLVGCVDNQPPIDTPEKKEITNVSMSNKSVVYDGNEHSILVEGTLPEGVTVVYGNNGKTDVGTYTITAVLSGEEYKTKNLSATLTITNRMITGITFSDKTVNYDGNLHKIEISGTLPSGVTVVYTSNTTGVTNAASEVGTYEVTATLSGVGYETLVLTADLEIKPFGEPVFTGITFTNKTVVYDGNEHTIEISGALPEGALVVYSSTTQGITNKATQVGTYNVTATITKSGYQTLTIQAVLTITASETQTFQNITFDDLSIEYDSFEHTIVISGVLPEDTDVVYSSDVDGVTNKASEVGVYNVSVTISKDGYETLNLTAKLTIKAKDKERFVYYYQNNIYFNNGLDDENLYMYNDEGLTKVNNDEAKYMIIHNGSMFYVSQGIISTSIKNFDGTKSDTVFSVNGEYLISDGSNLYYAVNPLFGDAGIYKLNIDGEEPVSTKVFTGRTKHLTLVGNDIYFANGNDDYKLYKINKNQINGVATLVHDVKIKELVHHEGSLYFTVNNLLGDYLARYVISSSTMIKLTSDNAKYLAIAGEYVYYSNVDIINSSVFGKGLYRVALNGLVDKNLPGELVYETEYNVSSLYAQDSETILFYRLSDKHLLSIDTTTKNVTDLMESFESPVEDSPQLLSKFESFVWNHRVYYINNYVDGALFYYDTKTNETIRVTASAVKSFSILGDYLFFNQISWLINNDIYMINLRTGGLPEKISSNDGRDMVLYNGFLYYVKENAAGVGTAITRLSLDGSNTEVDVYAYNSHNLTIQDGKLYFIKGAGVDEIWRADLLSNGDLANITRVGTDKTDWFILVGNQIYYRAVGTINKTLSKANLDGSNKVNVITGYDPISFIIKDGYIYFTNDTAFSPKDGLYRANLDGSNIQLLYENTSSNDGFAMEMNIVGNYLYFYSKSDLNGDFKFRRINLTTLAVEVIE
jgi:hypothetical protein